MASFMTTTSKSLLLLALILFLVKASATNDPETCAWKHGSGKECANPDATETNSSKATSTGTPGICVDDRDECAAHAARGDCKTNPRFMLAHCKFSCNACPKNLKYFETDWGEPQESSGSKTAQIEEVIHETETYMKEKVYKQAMYISVRNECLNRDKLCSKWASEGECKKNPQWMHIHCAPACQTCERIDMNMRCPVNEAIPKVWSPGSIDYMFNRLVTDPYFQQYKPKVLSKPPDELSGFVPAVHNTKLPDNDKPWLVTLDNFLTDAECDRLIKLGHQAGYKQSHEVGGQNFDGTHGAHTSLDRTSFNAWCFEKECYEDKIVQQILKKVENVTEIPEKNSEFLQLLRYEEGQLYHTHHDYVPSDFQRAQGVRVLTVFFYLNDVQEGGETDFPDLGLTITPKKGKAVLWPNTYNANPDARDSRTMHQALPVKKGEKFAANLWIHQRDFKTPFYNLCN